LNDTATPLERLKDWAGKATLSDGEAREYEKRYQLDRTAALTRDTAEFELDVAGDLDTYEPGRLLPGNRTSLITDPTDGRVPALTTEAQRRLSSQNERLNGHYAEGPENFTNPERCLIVANTSAPPMLPAFYNNSVQIVQTHDYVVIQSEMIHDTRIVPLDRRTHLPAGLGQWRGDSIGHWEGDTLVVDTTNFNGKGWIATHAAAGWIRGIPQSRACHVVERLRRADANTIHYEVTIDDPNVYTRPWTVAFPLNRDDPYRIYEYACHEGNHALENMLRLPERENQRER
jgi:hypothetical protein